MSDVYTLIFDGWNDFNFSWINAGKTERKGVYIAPRMGVGLLDGAMIALLIAVDVGVVDGELLIEVEIGDEVGFVGWMFLAEGAGGTTKDGFAGWGDFCNLLCAEVTIFH